MAITEINGVKGKKCSRCKQWRTLEFYHKDVRRRDGYAYYCKECCSLRRSVGTSKQAKPTPQEESPASLIKRLDAMASENIAKLKQPKPTPQKESPLSLLKRLDALASENIAKLIKDYPQVANDEYVEIYRSTKASLERDQKFLMVKMQEATSRGAYSEAKDLAAKLELNVKMLINLKNQYENENDVIVALSVFKSVRDKIADCYDMVNGDWK